MEKSQARQDGEGAIQSARARPYFGLCFYNQQHKGRGVRDPCHQVSQMVSKQIQRTGYRKRCQSPIGKKIEQHFSFMSKEYRIEYSALGEANPSRLGPK